jgi:predicted small lipoprotein YifL
MKKKNMLWVLAFVALLVGCGTKPPVTSDPTSESPTTSHVSTTSEEDPTSQEDPTSDEDSGFHFPWTTATFPAKSFLPSKKV